MRNYALLLVIIFVAGCSESPTAPRELPFETVYANRNSGIVVKRGEVVVSAERWAAVWAEIHAGSSPVPPMPLIDFDHGMVVLVAMGETPDACWSVAIESVESGPSSLYVRVKEFRSDLTCVCPPMTVQPVQVVRVPRAAPWGEFAIRKVIEGPPCKMSKGKAPHGFALPSTVRPFA